MSDCSPKVQPVLQAKKYKCNKCDYTTDYAADVRVHVQSAHNNSHAEVKITCDLCEEQFNSLTLIKMHKEVKHGQGLKIKCSSCQFETFHAAELKTHMKTKKCQESDKKVSIKV